MLFTSGSTGAPKGARISFGNLLNLFDGLVDSIYSRFEGHLNVALVAPLTFDASIQQIIAALLLGHTLYITQDSQRKKPEKLFKFIIEHKINIFDCTPTHIKMLNGILAEKSIYRHPLKCIIIGGESLKGVTIKDFNSKFNCRSPFIVNIYGVTECAVDSIYNFFDPNEVEYANLVPIGIPMKGVTIAVVDEFGKAVPNGNEGELCIGGRGVGLGYLDKDLNDKSFVKLKGYPDRLFYKTGDIAKVDDGGKIICLGRNDRQVKIRGNRVELDEIESCIMRINKLQTETETCSKCLLDSQSTVISSDGVCEICHLYEQNSEKLSNIFGNLNDFNALMKDSRINNKSKYDCILLYSGGKDSTYVLIRLIELGYKVLAYTFDNGYLSDQVFINIANITNTLGVDSVVETFPKMDEVFSESIKRYNTACDGCYKVLVTLSTKYAIENGISAIVTGLDRGQIIETKLQSFFSQGTAPYTPQYLDELRKVYHYWNNDFRSLVNVPGESKDIDRISFLDFFFYEDITEEGIYNRLKMSGIWERSYDTGLCSTNCRINDVGIATFCRANGYHNYAAPLSWQVRLKQITREEGLAKLSVDNLDYKYINEVLEHLGINTEMKIKDCHVILENDKLIAFINSSCNLDASFIRQYLKKELPTYMVPHRIMILDSFPLTESNKIDNMALIALAEKNGSDVNIRESKDPIISEVMEIWRKILGHRDFGVNDNFFDIGGDSLEAVLMSEEIKKHFNYLIPFDEIIDKFTISSIAHQIKKGQGGLH